METVDLDQVPEMLLAEGIAARAVHGERMTVAHVTLAAGALLPEHSHKNEQIVNVLAGELEIVVDGEEHVLTPGTALVLPPNVPHGGRARTAVRVIDVFSPIRDDWVY